MWNSIAKLQPAMETLPHIYSFTVPTMTSKSNYKLLLITTVVVI